MIYLLLLILEANGYSTLQEAGVRLVSHDVCKKPQVYGNHVTDDMICAGLSGCVDACQVGSAFKTTFLKQTIYFRMRYLCTLTSFSWL